MFKTDNIKYYNGSNHKSHNLILVQIKLKRFQTYFPRFSNNSRPLLVHIRIILLPLSFCLTLICNMLSKSNKQRLSKYIIYLTKKFSHLKQYHQNSSKIINVIPYYACLSHVSIIILSTHKGP